MIDRLVFAVLTFALMIGAALAIGADFIASQPQRLGITAPARVVQLERVLVVGKRLAPETQLAQSVATAAVIARVQ